MNEQKSTAGSCLLLIGTFILGVIGINKLLELFLSGGKNSVLAIGIACVVGGFLFQLNEKIKAEYAKTKSEE